MHSKYDDMYRNEIFYALIYISNHVIISISYMLSYAHRGGVVAHRKEGVVHVAWEGSHTRRKRKVMRAREGV